MSEEMASWRSGEIVPASGVYECDCGAAHRWSTDVRGHRFPPPPSGCPGTSWSLRTRTHAEAHPENHLG